MKLYKFLKFILGIILLLNLALATEKNSNTKNIKEELLFEKIEEKIKYIKKDKIFVYKDQFKEKKIDSLNKGTKIKILEEKKIKIGEKEKTIFKISYRKNLKNKIGWINNTILVERLNDTLPNSWKNLDFTLDYPVNNFENNPRVEVKGIYLNRHTLASEKKMERLIKLANDTEINAFVIDIKDDHGFISFDTNIPEKFGIKAGKYYPIKNIEEFMRTLKENNIYTIARIVSFKDPKYAKAHEDKVIVNRTTGKPFTKKDKIIWVSPHDRNLWEYNISVAEAAARVGFNEIQFDYVRFPASNGGKLDKILNYRNTKNESKPEAIQNYLKYARKRLNKLEVYICADVYGQIGTFKDDMGLGQHWEAVSKVTDYIAPMMYPSHYANNSYGVPVPDANPYKIIYSSTRDSINRNENITSPAIIRPWIQAFTAKWVKGHIVYKEEQIREQINALNDLGIKEYLLWSPSNNYKISPKNKY